MTNHRAAFVAEVMPRLIRFRDAPHYLGMDCNRFNSEVRPHLSEVPVGAQRIGFARLELDAWFEDYKFRYGRPARKGENAWDANGYSASSWAPGSGISTSASPVGDFARALEQVTPGRRKAGKATGTIDHGPKEVRRILNLAASECPFLRRHW
jgi:hypothetical protein